MDCLIEQFDDVEGDEFYRNDIERRINYESNKERAMDADTD